MAAAVIDPACSCLRHNHHAIYNTYRPRCSLLQLITTNTLHHKQQQSTSTRRAHPLPTHTIAMSYYQAHLLLLAGYSQFFVSGLVLPQPAFDDEEEDYDMTPEEEEEMESFMDEDESPEDATIVVDEPCPRFAAADDDEEDFDIEDAEPVTPVTPAGPVPGTTSHSRTVSATFANFPPEQRRRKRLSVVSESHVRTMSRWLLDSAISLGDRQRQVSNPESLSVSILSPSIRKQPSLTVNSLRVKSMKPSASVAAASRACLPFRHPSPSWLPGCRWPECIASAKASPLSLSPRIALPFPAVEPLAKSLLWSLFSTKGQSCSVRFPVHIAHAQIANGVSIGH